jgi:hypothetical protein
MPITVRPTKLDYTVARAVTRHTNPPTEQVSKAVTWEADEHVLCGLAAGWWLICRFRAPAQRRTSNHLLATSLVVAVVPHLLKSAFDQRRPDRVNIIAHLEGVPFSGKARDAFPSGHALHMGAIASAATELPAAQRNTVWALSGGLVLTRIVLLAHWTTDVLAGLAIGAMLERVLRPVTGFGTRNSQD